MNQLTRKVFISYSWGSEQYQKRVIELAERLVSDGVDIALDVWDLKKGHNLHKFMESMVSSEAISKVLLIVDKEYQRKANEGSGGVGVETEIVSAQIYNKADQDKFIPIVFEQDENGNPYLPVFLSSRVYINLAGANQRDEYHELLRTIYDKPRYVKPTLGKAPAFLESGVLTSAPSSFFDLNQAFLEGNIEKKPKVTSNFFYELNQLIRGTIIIKDPAVAPTDDEIIEKIQTFEPIIIDFDKTIDSLIQTYPKDLTKNLRDFFESCHREYSFRGKIGNYYEDQYAPAKFITQELLLHTVAAFVRHEKFSEMNDLFNAGIIIEKHGTKELGNLFKLYEFIRVIDEVRNNRLNLNRVSLTADLIKDRAKGIITFDEIIQADAILFLKAEFSNQFWYPRTLIYTDEWYKMPLFLRSEVKSYFENFAQIFGVSNKAEFKKLGEEKKEGLTQMRFGWRSFNWPAFYNVEKLSSK